MQYIITCNFRGQRITKTAANDFLAFTIIGQLNQDGVTDICMNQVNEVPMIANLSEKEIMQKTQGLKRMRTISQIMEFLKEEDPESCISEHYLRQLVKHNQVPVFHAGRRQLISLDGLLEYLGGQQLETRTEEVINYGVIRKVNE